MSNHPLEAIPWGRLSPQERFDAHLAALARAEAAEVRVAVLDAKNAVLRETLEGLLSTLRRLANNADATIESVQEIRPAHVCTACTACDLPKCAFLPF